MSMLVLFLVIIFDLYPILAGGHLNSTYNNSTCIENHIFCDSCYSKY